MNWILLSAAILLLIPATTCRLYFVAPSRIGAVFYYSNVFSDLIAKRTFLRRGIAEHALFLFGVVLTGFLGLPGIGVAAGAVVSNLVLEGLIRHREREILTSQYVHFDRRNRVWSTDQSHPTHPGAFPRPSVHPDLVVNLIGPFVARVPKYELGDLVAGREFGISIVVGNHSPAPCQVPISVTARCRSGVRCLGDGDFTAEALEPGQVAQHSFRFLAAEPSDGGDIEFSINHADATYSAKVFYSSVFDARDRQIRSVSIERFPGGCRSAFAWRGDMDLYDRSSFQSIDGLRITFGLASRYRFPQTMYLSSRLSLDTAEAEQFAEHFGVDRGHSQIADFVDWIRAEVDLVHRSTYPFQSNRTHLIELGNHMHLHYGTDAAAAAGNGWRLWSRMGDGTYPWQGDDKSSLGEQRDNARKAREIFEELFDYTPKSWAMPDSTRDTNTPAAVEAAGCEVTSDVDARQLDNVVFQPPPHVPPGTQLVELTKRYPGDPEDFVHVQMIVYWMHRAQRLRIPVVFMCHQHMRLFASRSCARMTEFVLRDALTSYHGDFHIDTVYGIGVYWRDLLDPATSVAELSIDDEGVAIRSRGSLVHQDVPVDVVFDDGKRCTYLVDIDPDSPSRVRVASQRSDTRQ